MYETPIKYPVHLQWEVTPFCNHDCVHCYNHWRIDKDITDSVNYNYSVSEEYNLEIARRIVESKPVQKRV